MPYPTVLCSLLCAAETAGFGQNVAVKGRAATRGGLSPPAPRHPFFCCHHSTSLDSKWIGRLGTVGRRSKGRLSSAPLMILCFPATRSLERLVPRGRGATSAITILFSVSHTVHPAPPYSHLHRTCCQHPFLQGAMQ